MDLAYPTNPVFVESIDISTYGGGVNSVDVKNGLLAAAIEANIKTDNGKIVVFETTGYAEIASVEVGALPDMVKFTPDGRYILSANEGDSRDYKGFSEEVRIGNKAVTLDSEVFPNADFLKQKQNLGRLNITNTLGDIDGDGDYDKLYSYGARSFSIWNGHTGKQIYDSGDFLDKTAVLEGSYDDARSDDKGVEPETVVIGRVGNKNLLFVGMERADAVAVYDVTNPVKPKYLQWLKCGDAPKGIIFIPAEESPVGKSLLVVSSENDGVVTVFITM